MKSVQSKMLKVVKKQAAAPTGASLDRLKGMKSSKTKKFHKQGKQEKQAKTPNAPLVTSKASRSEHTDVVVNAVAHEQVQVDLVPWTAKRPDRIIIKRENWNAHVKRIQAHACSEAEQENEELHKQLHQVLNERDNALAKYREMEVFCSKFSREFIATYGA